MVRTQNEDDTHTSVMQKLKEQTFEQFKLILIMHQRTSTIFQLA
jgi:hypothetical protein